jgi:cyclase
MPTGSPILPINHLDALLLCLPLFFTTCYNSLSVDLSLRLNPEADMEDGGLMKQSMTSSLLPWLLLMSPGWVIPSQAQTPVAVQKIQIADGIYQFSSAPDGYVPNDNSIVIVNQADVLVFDTFSRVSTARTVLAEIRKITDKPVRFVVNSHHHPDHWSGNEVYAEAFPSLEIIASEQSRRYMLNIRNSWPPVWTNNLRKAQAALDKEVSTGKQQDGTPLTAEQRHKDEEDVRLERDWVAELTTLKRTYPTLTYSDQLTLRHGGREFRFMSMTGDATGTTVLYLPKEKILLTGDAVSYPIPEFNSNLPLSQKVKTLRRLNQLDADVIIPGHGPALRDKGLLNSQAELFESVISQVEELVQQGMVTVEEMQKVVNVEPFRSTFTHNDKELNEEFHNSVNSMVEFASREARDGRKWEY